MKRRLLIILVAAASLCMVLEQSAWAQRGGRGRGGRGGGVGFFGGGGFGGRGFGFRAGGLWSREDVQTELKLSDEQKGKLEELNNQRRDSFRNFRDMSDEERAAAQEEQQKQTQQELAKILSAPQLARLKQIELQQEGPPALARDEVSGELGLSEEQKGKIGEIVKQSEEESGKLREEMRGAFGGGGFGGGGFDRDQMQQRMQEIRDRTEQINKGRDERLLAVLNEDQRDKWQAMLGAAFELQQDQGGFGGRGGFGGFGGGGGAAGRGRERARPAAEALPPAEVDPNTGEKLIRFNFQYHPWDEVLNWFADQAGLSLQADNKPTGTCNYQDPTAYKTADAMDRLNELLITKKFILIRKDKTLFCWDLENPIPPSLVPEVKINELDQYGENSMVTVKLFLERLVAEDTAKQLDALKGPFGTVTALPSANLLVVTDTAGNIRRLRDVLLGVDQSNGEGGLKVFQLRYTHAKEVANQVRQVLHLPVEEDENTNTGSNSGFGRGRSSFDFRSQMFALQRRAMEQAARGGAPAAVAAPQASVVADTRMNRVLVSAPPNQLALAEQTINELDKPLGTGDPTLAPQLMVYRVTRRDPATVVSFLKEILGEDSPVKLTADVSSGTIYASGSMGDQTMIRNLIDQIEGAGAGSMGAPGRKVFSVGTLDAEQLTELLRVLWRQSGGENPIILAPGAGQSSLLPGSSESRVLTPQSLRRQRQRQSREVRFSSRRSRDRNQADTAGQEAGAASSHVPPAPSTSKTPPRPAAPPQVPSESVTQREGKTARVQAAAPGPQREARVRETYVSFVQEQEKPSDETQQKASAPPAQQPAVAPQGQPKLGNEPQGQEKAPVIIRLENGMLTVQSEDKEALERIERLLSAIVPASTAQAPFYVAPLREAAAEDVAATIDEVMRNTSSLSSETLGTVSTMRVIPEVRTNSLLIVGATESQRSTIAQLVEVLDTPDLPENALNRQPQLIPVHHTSATEVADVLRDVFADQLEGNGRGGSAAPSNGQDPRSFFLARFGQQRGGFNGRSSRSDGRTQQTARRSVTGHMTLGVDERTNTIVVSAPQPLFEQVEDLVKQLDEAAQTNNRSIRLVPVRLSNVSAAQQTLSVLLGTGSNQNSSNRGRPATNNPAPTGFPGFFQGRGGFQGFQRSQGNATLGGAPNSRFGGFNGFTRNRGGSDGNNNGGNFFRSRGGGGDNGGRSGRRGGFRGGNGGE